MSYEKLNPEVFKKMQEHERSKLAGDLSKKILGSLNKSFLGPQTVAWLKDMKEDLRISGSGTHGADSSLTALAILDKLFDEFQRYSFQYNQNEPNNAFIISCRRPNVASLNGPSDTCEGFVYNSRWSMLVRAEQNTVTLSFVAPRFVYEQEQFKASDVSPFLQFDGENIRDGMIWRIDKYNVNFAQLPTVAKAAFARLIRVTRGECGDSEKLTIDFVGQTPQPPANALSLAEDALPTRVDIATDLIMTLIETLDAELEELEQVGIKAVRSSEPEVSQILLERSKSLREFRRKAAEMAKDWANLLNDNFQNQN